MIPDPQSSEPKTVLIAAPHFPPANVAGVHRPRHLAKWLPAHGWRPIVIRVHEDHYTETLDPRLAELVPPTVIQKKVCALSAELTKPFGVTEISLRSFWALRNAIGDAVYQYEPKVIMITGSPYYPMLLSGWIKHRLGLPVVLDFQDPWVSAWGATLPQFSKGGIAHQLAVALEPRAVRHADYITSVSERQNEEMAQRYPWLDAGRMAAVPIGGDPEDFDALRAGDTPSGLLDQFPNDAIVFSYVGTFLPRASGVIRPLFRAVKRLRDMEPELGGRIRLNFIGTSNQPDGTLKTVEPIAEREGVGDLLVESPGRIPYLDALSVLAQSRALMLIGSDEPHYTASKIYPALMSGTPFISLFHQASSAHKILSAAGGGLAFAFDSLKDLDRQVPDIAVAVKRLAENPSSFGTADSEAYADYTASAVSEQYARIFEEVSR